KRTCSFRQSWLTSVASPAQSSFSAATTAAGSRTLPQHSQIDAAPTPASLPAMSAASAMLEIPEVRARVSPITVAQYHQLPEFNGNGRRTELIHGVIIEKMSKSPLHSGIASALYDLIHPQVPPGFWLRKEEPLTLGDS